MNFRRYLYFGACFLSLAGCKTVGNNRSVSHSLSDRSSVDVVSDSAPKLALHDVSVLFPDDLDRGENYFLRPNSPGLGGELLPKSFVDGLPVNDNKIHMASFRIDPCFPRLEFLDSKPELCGAQVRLVFIPNISVIAHHAAYKLERATLEAMLKELAALGDHSDKGLAAPLGIHPKMAAEGIDGPTARAMRAIVLKYVGVANLIGLASLEFPQAPTEWQFVPRLYADGKFVEQTIPTLTTTRENFTHIKRSARVPGVTLPDPRNGFFVTGSSKVSRTESVKNPDTLALKTVLDDSLLMQATQEELDKAFSHIAKLDNPNMTHFDNTPCVSCHISSGIESETFLRRNIEMKDGPNRYQSFLNLTQTSKGLRRFPEIRNFSHSKAISQRTVNESAAVVEALIKHKYLK